MHKFTRLTGLLLTFLLITPALAAAQVATGSTTVDVEIQSLLNEISSLQQQLKSLLQSAVPTTAPAMWASASASSTPPGIGMNPGNCSAFSRDLFVGSEGGDVSRLQQMLQGAGYLSASSTGYFGSLTEHALGEYQMHFGIASSSSGKFFGPLTRRYVENHCGDGGGKDIGSTTPGMMSPIRPAGEGGDGQNGTSTIGGGEGSQLIYQGILTGSTTPLQPCQNNEGEGLFVPHVILPTAPCGGQGAGNQGENSGSQKQDN